MCEPALWYSQSSQIAGFCFWGMEPFSFYFPKLFFFFQSVCFLLFMVTEVPLSQWWVRDLTKIFSNVWMRNKKWWKKRLCLIKSERCLQESSWCPDYTINTIPNFVRSLSLAVLCPGRLSRNAGCYSCVKVGVRNGAWSLVHTCCSLKFD